MATNTTKTTQQEKGTFPKEVFALWKNTSKEGKSYFSGIGLIGFYAGQKENPKQPDLTIYEKVKGSKELGKETASLWCSVSKAGKKYLTGHLKDEAKTKIIAFITEDTKDGKYPYLRVYKQADIDSFNHKEEVKKQIQEENDLPF